MCEIRSRKNGQEQKKKKYSGQQQKEIDCDEPHPAPNEKTQPIQWTERPTGALVAVDSLCPKRLTLVQCWLAHGQEPDEDAQPILWTETANWCIGGC